MTEKNISKGKKNRKSGSQFELKVRKDLEAQGWIVDKWGKNVEDDKLIQAKNKFIPGRPMMLGAGFPDFIAFRTLGILYEIIGVEAKSNGYLNPEERKKCKWLLDNKIFSKILVAKKGDGKIIYTDVRGLIKDGKRI